MNSDAFLAHIATYYSQKVLPTIDGMLGGLAYVHSDDVAWSRKFIKGLQKKKVIRDKAVLDVGAGIGRVSSYCLKDCFVSVDMLEQNKAFIDASETNFAKGRIRNRFNIPVQ